MKQDDIKSANDLYVDATVNAAESMEKLTNAVDDSVTAAKLDTKQTRALTDKKKDLTYEIVDNSYSHSDDTKATKDLSDAKSDLAKALKEQSENVGDFSNQSGDASAAQKDFAKFMKESVSAMKAEMKETRAQMKEERASRKEEADERKRKSKLDKEEFQAQRESLKEDIESSKLEKERLKLEKERIKAQRERDKIQSQLEKQQNIVDYSKRLNQANKKLAELVNREQKKREQLIDDIERESEEDEYLRKIKDKYRRQAEKEYKKRIGLFQKMNKSIERYSKTSESAMGRMSAKMFMSGTGFLSDKIDKLTDVPVIKQGKGAYRFVRDNIRGAREATRQKKIREHAQKLRKADLAGMKDSDRFDNAFVNTDETASESITKAFDKYRKTSREKQVVDELKKANVTLTKIYDHLIFKSLVGFAGTMAGGTANLTGSIGKAVAGALGSAGLYKLLGKLSDLPGLGGPKGLPGGGGGPKSPKGPKGGPSGIGKGYTIDGEYEVVKDKPKLPKPKTSKVGKFEKIKSIAGKFLGKALTKRGAAKLLLKVGARFAGPIGAAMMIYDVADACGLVDKAEQLVGDAFEGMFGGEDGKEADLPKADKLTPTQASALSKSAQQRAMAGGYYGTANTVTSYNYNAPSAVAKPTYLQAEQIETKLNRATKEVEAAKQAATNQSISDAVNMNVISSNNVNNTNNFGSSFNFDNSMYQTLRDRGQAFQR